MWGNAPPWGAETEQIKCFSCWGVFIYAFDAHVMDPTPSFKSTKISECASHRGPWRRSPRHKQGRHGMRREPGARLTFGGGLAPQEADVSVNVFVQTGRQAGEKNSQERAEDSRTVQSHGFLVPRTARAMHPFLQRGGHRGGLEDRSGPRKGAAFPEA